MRFISTDETIGYLFQFGVLLNELILVFMSFCEMKLEKIFLKIIDGINDKSKNINNKIESNFNILLNIIQIFYSLNGMIVIVKHKLFNVKLLFNPLISH
jgi:hypothetical protein